MKNRSLTDDYIRRAEKRLKAVEILMKEESYPDVVRESQEVVELCLKALLRHSRLEVPRIHDVGDALLQEMESIPPPAKNHIKRMAKISKALRKDRELAFYGAEDLTPSEFYKEDDAREALEGAQWVFSVCKETIMR